MRTLIFIYLLIFNSFFAQTSKFSLLLIIKINTNGNVIAVDPKVMADLKIIYNRQDLLSYLTGPVNHYNGKIGIDYRESSSQWIYLKKSYGFETWNVSGMSIDTALLNIPSDNDWVFVSAYSDKSQIRKNLTYLCGKELVLATKRFSCGFSNDIIDDNLTG
jgi:hypothetical protein